MLTTGKGRDLGGREFFRRDAVGVVDEEDGGAVEAVGLLELEPAQQLDQRLEKVGDQRSVETASVPEEQPQRVVHPLLAPDGGSPGLSVGDHLAVDELP